MSRSPLTEKFLRIIALRDEVKTWPQDEQDFFLDMLTPEPVKSQGRAGKRASKKSSKSASKSARASSLQTVIQRTPKTSTGNDRLKCSFVFDDGHKTDTCAAVENDPIHDPTMGYAGYHEFDAGKSSAQPARARSSTNGEAGSSTASSEVERKNASTATGG